MKIAFCCLPALLLSAGASAGAVIYTDTKHPVSDGQNAPVVFLDAQEHAQALLFGHLSTDPGQAERDARAILSSPNFRQSERQLAEAYAGLTKAWSLGLQKYPAVVFDDKWVVYGTTDVGVAMQHLTDWKEKAQ